MDVAVVASNWLYASSRSLAASALTALLSCIAPFTLLNPVLTVLLDPTFPVSCEFPLLVIAPVVVKSTKLAALPKFGACPKEMHGNNKRTIDEKILSNFFNFFTLSCERIITSSKSSPTHFIRRYTSTFMIYIIHI